MTGTTKSRKGMELGCRLSGSGTMLEQSDHSTKFAENQSVIEREDTKEGDLTKSNKQVPWT